VIAYLRVHGINKEATDRILNNEWKYPAAWERGITLSQHIDVPMHLIFLGIVKTCIQLVHDWILDDTKVLPLSSMQGVAWSPFKYWDCLGANACHIRQVS
jgi:hypothetical protein